jgi:hypothetical protein
MLSFASSNSFWHFGMHHCQGDGGTSNYFSTSWTSQNSNTISQQAWQQLSLCYPFAMVSSIWQSIPFPIPSEFSTSTDLFLALTLAMEFFTPCSAILSQSYGKSIGQFWHIFA